MGAHRLRRRLPGRPRLRRVGGAAALARRAVVAGDTRGAAPGPTGLRRRACGCDRWPRRSRGDSGRRRRGQVHAGRGRASVGSGSPGRRNRAGRPERSGRPPVGGARRDVAPRCDAPPRARGRGHVGPYGDGKQASARPLLLLHARRPPRATRRHCAAGPAERRPRATRAPRSRDVPRTVPSRRDPAGALERDPGAHCRALVPKRRVPPVGRGGPRGRGRVAGELGCPASRSESRVSLGSADHPSVLLAHSYYMRYDPKQSRKMKPYPPLSTLIAAALLRRAGRHFTFFDAMLSEGVDEFRELLHAGRPQVGGLMEDNFNFLTKMCTIRMREAAFEMISAAKSAGARVVVNGSDAIDQTAAYLHVGADAVILGEAEETFLDLTTRWSDDPDADLSRVAGLAIAGSAAARSSIPRTPARRSSTELDALPFPAWELIDVEQYRVAWTAAHGRLSWNVCTSRGSPY